MPLEAVGVEGDPASVVLKTSVVTEGRIVMSSIFSQPCCLDDNLICDTAVFATLGTRPKIVAFDA